MPMPADTSQRIRRLREARRRIVALATAAARDGRQSARRLDAAITRLRGLVRAGRVSKREATPVLGRLVKAQRVSTRLMAESRAVTARTLADIDGALERLRRGA